MNEFDRVSQELEEALDEIDDVCDRLGNIIIELAGDNKDFVCSACIRTAKELYDLLKEFAREEDCDSIREQFQYITGIDLED